MAILVPCLRACCAHAVHTGLEQTLREGEQTVCSVDGCAVRAGVVGGKNSSLFLSPLSMSDRRGRLGRPLTGERGARHPLSAPPPLLRPNSQPSDTQTTEGIRTDTNQADPNAKPHSPTNKLGAREGVSATHTPLPANRGSFRQWSEIKR